MSPASPLTEKLSLMDLMVPAEACTLLVTPSCPPQMAHVRGARRLWAYPQFELKKLVGSGKTSNVYQARAAAPHPPASGAALTLPQALCIRSATTVALKVYPKARVPRAIPGSPLTDSPPPHRSPSQT